MNNAALDVNHSNVLLLENEIYAKSNYKLDGERREISTTIQESQLQRQWPLLNSALPKMVTKINGTLLFLKALQNLDQFFFYHSSI